MSKKLCVTDLKREPIFWSRLGFCYDPPMKNNHGKPLVFTEDFSKTLSYHKAFSDHGIRFHTSILHTGWVGIDEYDYSLTDRVLDAIMGVDDSVYYMPRVKLNVPIDWCRENPEDTYVYYEGPKGDAEAIRALVGTSRHDILGYEAPEGYYRAGDYVDTRPNVGGVISLQSLSSKKWLADASVALEKLIQHIENGKYADRIIGYHICFGPCGEAMHWGRASNHYGDYGINQLRNFYDYGLAKYGNANLLSEKWQLPSLTRDTVVLPSPEERYEKKDTLTDLFRADAKDIICRDYDEFLSQNVSQALDIFAGVAKKCSEGKPVGCFYGYFCYVDNAAFAGHVDIDGVLSSENIDFLAAPMPYYRRVGGQPGGEMCFNQSINRKKLWVDEIDCRTHLAEDGNPAILCRDMRDVKFCLWREICKDISHGSGFWWMDLGGGWYDSDEIMHEVGRITAHAAQLQALERNSVSDILVVADEKNYYDMKISAHLRCAFLEEFLCETRLSGALCDTYRLSDLPNLDLSQYKLIVFAMNYKNDRELFSKIKIPTGATIMYNYAAGVRCGESVSTENIKSFTGFEVEEYHSENFDFPMLREKHTGHDIAVRSDDKNTYILNCRPNMQSHDIRRIAIDAGCRIYAPSNCAVYGDSTFVGVFACRDTVGDIVLPDGEYTEIVSGCDVQGGTHHVEMKEDDVMVFVKK